MTLRPYLLPLATTAAVLAPFAFSFAAHALPARATRAIPSDRPPLHLGEYLVNLGRLPEGAVAQGVFRFVNGGDTPLTIVESSPSCGCLKPLFKKRTYAPGEPGAFIVVADTAGEGSDQGDALKEHFVDVRYDAGHSPQTARVHLKFVLPARRITVEPRSLLLYRFGDQPISRELTVSDARGRPATVTTVTCADPRLAIEPRFAESADDPHRATITLTVPPDVVGKVETRLVIRTDDPDQPAVIVPVVIDARATGAATAGGVPLELIPAATRR